jgi:pimeloyl-ACP methyl ester carboxylesterase
MAGTSTSLVTTAGETTISFLDRFYKPSAGTRRGVMVTHGAGILAASYLDTTYRRPLDALARAGYPCLAIDAGGASTWGNDTAIAAIQTDVSVLTGTTVGAKSDKVFIYGGSMGAITALNWARQHPTMIGAIALTIPALDLDNIYQNNKGGFQASIGTAYGVAYPTAIPGLTTHSPVAYPTDVTFPLKLWASSDDPIASNTAACQAWASAVGANVTVVDLGARGHNGSTTPPDDIVAFFDANGGRS